MRPEGRRGRGFGYVALVGVCFVVIVLVAGINMFRTTDSGTVGIGDVGIGEEVAPFAVPLAASQLDGDANVDPAEACGVGGDDVLRICDFFGKPLVISFWFTRRASECIEQQDVFDRVADRFRGRVGMVSINVRDDRDRVRELIREHRWTVPVGYDRDGAVSNLYRVGGCPTFLFVAAGGTLKRAEIGRTTVARLSAQVRSLLDGQAEAEERPPAEKSETGS
ncbi:MAG: TlpA family protein disulfide reductase [Solirubrobacterales bacterium]|nr:TlpA family protein disulfide reductase [Solirubrobacterales bacterium]